MTDEHLLSAMLYLYRNDSEGSEDKRAWRWDRVLSLAHEAQRRGLLPDPMSEAALTTWLDSQVTKKVKPQQVDKTRSTKPYKGSRGASLAPMIQRNASSSQVVPYKVQTPTLGTYEPAVSLRATPRKLDLTNW